jgi:hypothetical protein
MTENTYAPGTYVKGDDERVANTASAAVALAFEGYRLKEEAVPAPVEEQKTSESNPTPAALAAPKRKSQEDTQS